MGLRELKKELNKMEKTEIIKLISEIYKKLPRAKEYLDIYTTGNVEELIEKYKVRIENYLYPGGRDSMIQDKEARKLIRNIRKMKIPELTIALELYYVRISIDMIEIFGFWDDAYKATSNMFYSATNGAFEYGLQDDFEEEINDLV